MIDEDTYDYENCPFSYRPGEEPPPIVHKVIGVCCECRGDGHTILEGRLYCFGCVYGPANEMD